jgi:glucose/arabinose dehydrogenase
MRRFGDSEMLAQTRILCLTLLMPCFALAAEQPVRQTSTVPLSAPPGFRVEVLAEVPKARSMVLAGADTLLVSTQFAGKLYAISKAFSAKPEVHVLAEKLKVPNGIAYADGDLYVAQPERLLRYADVLNQLKGLGEPEVILDDLPAGKLHSWRYLAFGPDGKLYMTIGAPCNVCDAPDTALILRMNRDGTQLEVFAEGIRNSVGLAWQPGTNALWFTDNGRDMLGDDTPPDELNRAEEAGLHFGFPFCHGGKIPDPDPQLASLGSCSDSVPPVQPLSAHVAPLGLTFYTGDMFPAAYKGQILIAEHGSWNRSKKIGYRVSLVRLDAAGKQAVSYEPFIDGGLDGDEVYGRPVDLLVAPDGALLVSDDYAGKIYRVSYVGASQDQADK